MKIIRGNTRILSDIVTTLATAAEGLRLEHGECDCADNVTKEYRPT